MEVNRKQLRVFSHTLKRHHFTVWLMCSFVLSVKAQCPCNYTCSDRSVICEDSEEIKLPLEVPRGTQNLTLNNKNISVLIERAFSANGTDMDLRELSLRDNNIRVIENCAFCGLPRLHTLDLSRNRLEVIRPYAFSGLGQLRYLYLSDSLTAAGASQLGSALSSDSLNHLQTLDLSGNRLKEIPFCGFDSFNLTELKLTNNSFTTLDINCLNKTNAEIRIYLSHNPFDCGCDKLKFYEWLKHSSKCADLKQLKCARPKASTDKFVETVDCKTEPNSFVLLGIVLALIGIVFLMVLYLNRRGIKRWLNNIREACRDQMEVYHYRYEQDSDPRLTNVAV